jgi:hypothetical protein
MNKEDTIISVYEKDDEGNKIVDDLEQEINEMEQAPPTTMTIDQIPSQDLFCYHDGNSPMTMSPYQSDDDDADESKNRCNKFRQLSYEEIEQEIEKHYYQTDSLISNELDALITYIKGQKHLFNHSKQYIQRNLNMLILPAILISAFIAVFSSFLEDFYWSHGFIAGLNALVALCISVANYFKLERKSHGYYLTAFQYDKIETSLEFVSSKIAFMKDENDKEKIILEKIQETEEKICEIKEWNHSFIPNDVQKNFPIIAHMNIFSFIKRLESNKKLTFLRFQNIKNEIRYIQFVFQRDAKELSSEEKNKMQQRLIQLFQTKDSIKNDIICYCNAYGYLDNLFNIEIANAENKASFLWSLCYPSKEKKNLVMNNHIVDAFFNM